MKKSTTITLVIALAFLVASCGGKAGKPDNPNELKDSTVAKPAAALQDPVQIEVENFVEGLAAPILHLDLDGVLQGSCRFGDC